jgi:hypothetical protein
LLRPLKSPPTQLSNLISVSLAAQLVFRHEGFGSYDDPSTLSG